jgi:hypothetical protein
VSDAAVSRALSARVQQAFLPKFENEGQDAVTAARVAAAAADHYVAVTVKHSGSLVTLSAGQASGRGGGLGPGGVLGGAAMRPWRGSDARRHG